MLHSIIFKLRNLINVTANYRNYILLLIYVFMNTVIGNYRYSQSSKYFSQHTKQKMLYCNLRDIPYEGKQSWQKSFCFCFKMQIISEENLYLKTNKYYCQNAERKGWLYAIQRPLERMNMNNKYMSWSNLRLCKSFILSPKRHFVCATYTREEIQDHNKTWKKLQKFQPFNYVRLKEYCRDHPL